MRSRSLQWFRALIPSWRFFDRPGDETVLLHRLRAAGAEEWSAWRHTIPVPPRRTPLSVFYNPQGTLRLALYNLLDASLEDIRDAKSAEDFQKSVSYDLLLNAVRFHSKAATGDELEIKLVTLGADAEEHLVAVARA